MKARNITEAWKIAYEIADEGTYSLDKTSEERAGYKIFRAEENPESRICDLGARLEVVTASGKSVNVWIDDDSAADNEPAAAPEDTADEPAASEHYGDDLAQKIRAEYSTAAELTDFEKFVLNHGYEHETKESLQAGYDRYWKTGHGILLTLEEFLAEAKKDATSPAVDTYEVLVGLYNEKKLTASEVAQYAAYRWCLMTPEALVAYKTDGPERWRVNNCGEKISVDEARVRVCEEWGFEASRVKIIGTPFYDSTDWQFIRFDCAGMAWLWTDEGLYKVFV